MPIGPRLLRRYIPLGMTFLIAVSLLVTYFFQVPTSISQPWEGTVLGFAVIIATAALGLGAINLLTFHVSRIRSKAVGLWHYSAVLVVCFVFTIVVGLAYGPSSDEFNLLYNSTVGPLSATLIGIFIIWLAYPMARAIRIHDYRGALLFLATVISLIGSSPIAPITWPVLSDVASWLNTVPNLAAQRAISITIAIGLVVMAIRVILGLERSYMRE